MSTEVQNPDPECEAQRLANEHVLSYVYQAIKRPEGDEHNLLSAAEKCGCNHCRNVYEEMLDFAAFGDQQVVDYFKEKTHYQIKKK